MRHLLLISNSTMHPKSGGPDSGGPGGNFLDHCEVRVRAHLASCRSLLFVPYALQDHAGYAAKARARFAAMELDLASIHEAGDPVRAVEAAQALFIGGGNTFRLLESLHRHRLLAPIRSRVAAGMPYLGASAGSNVACPTIRTTNDMPIVQPPSFEALALVPFQINPHYLDPDPGSKHMGETREQRLREFHEENAAPVVGLREGTMLRIEEQRCTLLGITGARLFRRGEAPAEFAPGSDLGFLLT